MTKFLIQEGQTEWSLTSMYLDAVTNFQELFIKALFVLILLSGGWSWHRVLLAGPLDWQSLL